MKKKNLILFGAGGHALSVIDVIEKTKKFKILFILDKFSGSLGNYDIYKQKKDINYYKKYAKNACIAIGQIKNSKIRSKLYNELVKNNFILPKIISPFALVSKTAKIGNGSIVMHHALINSFSNIGENCIINSKSLVEHGVNIENNCHLSTRATINGSVIIKKGSFIGCNATIIQGITVGNNSIIGAGKILKKNLPNNSLYK
jgi:sugar O-acyltransferase (sialic acid O-acetyltransferase NeuD family)